VSEMLAGAYLKAEGSEKTQASYLSTLCNNLATVSQNEEIAYVLSGDDFDFNLIDPENPKLFAISNNFSKNSVYAPVIGMLMTISSRQFTMRNKVPFVYFLDEMTTVNIKNFETLPSVLREYLCAFVLLTQSGSKVENQYGRLDRSSVEANFGNQFFGRTKDVESLKYYPMMFGKEEKERRSRSAGKSGGSTNRSVTVSSQKEDIYQGKDFADLEPGEFIGSATRANVSYFKVKLEMYDDRNEEPLPAVEPGGAPGGPLGTVKADHHIPAVENLPVSPALGQRGKGHGLGSVHAGDDNMHMQLQSRLPFTGFCLAGFHLGIIAFIVAFCFHTPIPYQIVTGPDLLPVKITGIFIHALTGEPFHFSQDFFLLLRGELREFTGLFPGHFFNEVLLLLTAGIDGEHIELVVVPFQCPVVVVHMMHDGQRGHIVLFL